MNAAMAMARANKSPPGQYNAPGGEKKGMMWTCLYTETTRLYVIFSKI